METLLRVFYPVFERWHLLWCRRRYHYWFGLCYDSTDGQPEGRAPDQYWVNHRQWLVMEAEKARLLVEKIDRMYDRVSGELDADLEAVENVNFGERLARAELARAERGDGPVRQD